MQTFNDGTAHVTLKDTKLNPNNTVTGIVVKGYTILKAEPNNAYANGNHADHQDPFHHEKPLNPGEVFTVIVPKNP